MSAPQPNENIEIAGFDPATGVVTDPAGRRVALLDPDGNWSVNAVATLFAMIAGGGEMVNALIDVHEAALMRRGQLPPAVLKSTATATLQWARHFFDAGGSSD